MPQGLLQSLPQLFLLITILADGGFGCGVAPGLLWPTLAVAALNAANMAARVGYQVGGCLGVGWLVGWLVGCKGWLASSQYS